MLVYEIKFQTFAIIEKGNYILVNITNNYNPSWLSCLDG